MVRFFHAPPAAAALVLAACGAAPAPPPPPPPAAIAPAPAAELKRLVSAYEDEYRELNPRPLPQGADLRFDGGAGSNISAQFLADSLDVERRYLDAVRALPRARLPPDLQLTRDLFERERELAVESFTYPSELLPVNPFRSVPVEFAQAAAGGGAYAVLDAEDYEHWRLRAQDFVRWTDQAIANMRDGLRRGYTEPRVIVAEMLPLIAALARDDAESVFYRPLAALPATMPDAERRRIAEGIRAGVRDEILPAYRALLDFLTREYLPRARQSVGLTALPLGESWYRFLIRRESASTLTPAQIQAIGAADADRLHARLQSLLGEAGYAGDPKTFAQAALHNPETAAKTPEELVSAYAKLEMQAAAALAPLFAAAPQAAVAVRPLERFREATSPALLYQRAARSGAAAVLYVNTAGIARGPLAPDAASLLREALPGYHYLLSIEAQQAALPAFRRYGGDPGFVQGWGIYAESLGEALGEYRDPESRFAAVADRLQCAAGAVIDTGLHALGWTRERALEYLEKELPVDESAAQLIVDRAIALPGEAVACALGARAIETLRARAEQSLGAAFDVRAFHAALLDDGAMPLDMLETRTERWLRSRHP